METVFLKLLNMSITASWLVLAVVLLRLLLKKAPKAIVCALWALVAVRLILPISFESNYSLVPSAQTIPQDIIYSDSPVIDSGITAVNNAVNPVISNALSPSPGDSVNPVQIITTVSSYIWIAGAAVMVIYTLISYLCLRKKTAEGVETQDGVWLCDRIDTPFILGVFKPRIFLPSTMNEKDIKYVTAHEKAHLKRYDHLWKPLGFALLTVYWFNPCLWLAYILLCRDIELACDERVIREMGIEIKRPYSDALINCSVPRRLISACPLAFGEVGVKQRIKRVLNYKKPAFVIIIIALIAGVAVAIGFLTNPYDEQIINESLTVFIDREVANRNSSDKTGEHYPGFDIKILDAEKKDDFTTTVYTWVMYNEYSYDKGLKTERGSHIPTVITVKKVGDHYELAEYWTPRDGSYYTDDIKAKFPKHLWEKALNSQLYAAEQSEICREKAQKYFESLTNILVKPPELHVKYHDTEIKAWMGTYSWNYDKGNGTKAAINADSSHPSALLDRVPSLETNSAYNTMSVALDFGTAPDEITVTCINIKTKKATLVNVTDNTFELKTGSYLYDISAVWNSRDSYGGTAYYAFQTVNGNYKNNKSENILEIVDKTEIESLGITAADHLECFYIDENHSYYFGSAKSEYVIGHIQRRNRDDREKSP